MEVKWCFYTDAVRSVLDYSAPCLPGLSNASSPARQAVKHLHPRCSPLSQVLHMWPEGQGGIRPDLQVLVRGNVLERGVTQSERLRERLKAESHIA